MHVVSICVKKDIRVNVGLVNLSNILYYHFKQGEPTAILCSLAV